MTEAGLKSGEIAYVLIAYENQARYHLINTDSRLNHIWAT